MMRRWRRFMLQGGAPGADALRLASFPLNSDASQSSNSGCVGDSPSWPKLLDDRTRPRPKWCCQIRLTITRAVRRLSGDVIQSARAVLRPEDFIAGVFAGMTGAAASKIAGNPSSTLFPGTCGFPREKTNVSGGFGITKLTLSACSRGGSLVDWSLSMFDLRS